MKSFAILQTSAPLANHAGIEALDMAMLLATLDIDTAFFIDGDGVYQLLAGFDPSTIGQKNFGKTYSALPFYDIDKIYVCKEAILERGLEPAQIQGVAEVLDKPAFNDALRQQNFVVTL